MRNVNEATGHDQYEELLGAAAFGLLDDAEQAAFDAHLATCESCQAEFAELLATASTLPLALDERDPPAALRERIAASVAAGHAPDRAAPVRIERPGQVTWLASRAGKAWVAAAAAILVAVVAIVLALALRDTGSGTETIDIAQLPPAASASLTYRPDDERFTFNAEGMPVLAGNQVYQVWLIAGDQPQSVGIMHGNEFAVTADRARYDAFAITVEPAPDGSPAPTSDPVVVAPLHPAG